MVAALTEEDFWAKFAEHSKDACWPWPGHVGRLGYAQAKFQGAFYLAHRLAYILARGEIPLGLVLDHLCRNRSCCNPDHLEPVTPRENVARGEGVAARNIQKTHCPRGHEYAPRNAAGRRTCKTCARAHSRAHDIKRRRRAA